MFRFSLKCVKMKILFIVNELGYIDPVGIAFLSAVAKRDGHETFFCSLGSDNLISKINTILPDILAYSAYSCSIDKMAAENKEASLKYEFVSIVGGPHATYCPEDTLARGFDACCIGEGEYIFKEFLEKVCTNKSYDEIDGLITQNQKDAKIRTLVEDLDELPLPDRDLVLSNTVLGDTSKKTFFSGGGCPFQCTYCLNQVQRKLYKGKGKYVRRFSVDRMIEEILYIKSKYRLDFVKFDDDLFALRADGWLEEFANKYSSKVGIPFNCLVRLDHVDDDLLKLLNQAGCYSITTSIDSSSERVRSEVLNRKMSNDLLIKNLNKLHQYGIKTYVNFMLGLPNATIKDEIQSVNIARETNITYLAYSFLVPFPGTKLWQYCVNNNYISSNYKVPDTMFDEPTLKHHSTKEKRICKNLFDLGQIANRANFVLSYLILFVIKYFPNIRLYRNLKRSIRKHYMENVIYKTDDSVVLKSDM